MEQETNTVVYVEHSQHYRPYMVTMAIGFILWFAYVCWTTYWAFQLHKIPYADMGIQLAALWYLSDILLVKVEYRLEDKNLVMIKKGLFRGKTLSIPYENIFGVHHFKNQLMKPVTYRYTFRQYSILDNRPIWSLLYDIGSTNKVGRVLMKGSETFWCKLEEKMPEQIRVTQEEVLTFTYKAIEKKLRDKGLLKGHPQMEFEEGVEQLRQEGTEMGGKEYEVTKDNFKDERK